MMDRIVMEVSRYRPEIESAPTFQAYEVPLTREWAVLDGLTYIKDHLDGTLSFRWSCRMGICGSSGMTINGDPKLACATFLADYLPGPVRVEPMRNFPVIRDLVVDISDFMAKLPSVKPWLVRHDEPPVEDGEYRQTPAELDAFKQFSMCINCMLCYSACPVYALDPDFLGPAAIALGQRYNLDSRDQGAADRRDVLAAADGAWACTLVGECSTACPKGVDPAGAIQRYKLTAATHALKKLLFPWGGGGAPIASRSKDTGGRGGVLTCDSCFAKSVASSWPGLFSIWCWYCAPLARAGIPTSGFWTSAPIRLS